MDENVDDQSKREKSETRPEVTSLTIEPDACDDSTVCEAGASPASPHGATTQDVEDEEHQLDAEERLQSPETTKDAVTSSIEPTTSEHSADHVECEAGVEVGGAGDVRTSFDRGKDNNNSTGAIGFFIGDPTEDSQDQ